MEEKINIAEILKDKPKGTKLYSRICGAVELKKVINVRKKKSIVVKELNSNNQHRFWHDGNFFRAGKCVLQPSENMADWSKFSWKKGDVLQNNDHSTQVIFDRFISDTYQMISCKYWLKINNGNERFVIETNVFTKDYFKVSEELSQCYINEIENRCGGKLNLETLEIEKTQPEFKDGDIVTIINGCEQRCILIFRNIIGDSLNRYCILTKRGLFTEGYSLIDKEDSLLFATEEEKNKLFSALEKEGKAWDSEKKQIVDLKPKVDELKPFDKVVVRCSEADRWSIDFFSYKVHNGYICTGDAWFGYCLPYNDETAHLLGTADDWKGGEG